MLVWLSFCASSTPDERTQSTLFYATFPLSYRWRQVVVWTIALFLLGASVQADEATNSAPTSYETYEASYRRAMESGKDLLVYFQDQESPGAAQHEFDTTTLRDPAITEPMNERFILVRLPKGQAIERRTTEQRTRYVRRRFRSVKETYQQVVLQAVLEDQADSAGFAIVRATGEDPIGGSELLAWFPFEETTLPPQVFRRDPQFKPWSQSTFLQIVRTPLAAPDEYLTRLMRYPSLQSAAMSVAASQKAPSLANIQYDYDYTAEHLDETSLSTRIHIGGNAQLALVGDAIDVRVDVYSLKDSGRPVKLAYAKLDANDKWQELKVTGLSPETPYRMELHFYWSSQAHPLIGTASMPFLGVTCGASRLAKVRARVATTALSELNDWKRGRYGQKGYVVGAWCERFYFWNIAKFVLPPYRQGYDPSIFSRNNALLAGSRVREIVTRDNVMGDHVRVPGHGFMLLCYDKHLNRVWSIEGNYGNRVVMTQRPLSGNWSLGRLAEEMLIPEDDTST